MYYLKGDALIDGKVVENVWIEIRKGNITYIGKRQRNLMVPVYEMDGWISPGLIDIHIHGVDGMDFMDPEPIVFQGIAEALPAYGVTSFLATSRTGTIPEIKDFLVRADDFFRNGTVGANMLGVHLEGPWISSEYHGAQPKENIRKLTRKEVAELIIPYEAMVKRITLAPEEVEDFSIMRELADQGVCCSAGHTNAAMEDVAEAITYGLVDLTHTFNAMSPVHHRSPGVAAAALFYEELVCELITDGVHVHPKIIELLYRIKRKDGIALISDCTGCNAIADGKYQMRGKELIKSGYRVTLADGILAGSAITLDQGVKYVVDHCSIPIEEAVYMAAQVPVSRISGAPPLGRIAPGYQADFMILDSTLNVKATIIKGETVYEK